MAANNQRSYAKVAASPPSKGTLEGQASGSNGLVSRQLDITPPDISNLSIMSDEDLEVVTAQGYGGHLLSRFSEFRDEGMFFDFTLKVENKSFQVIYLCFW